MLVALRGCSLLMFDVCLMIDYCLVCVVCRALCVVCHVLSAVYVSLVLVFAGCRRLLFVGSCLSFVLWCVCVPYGVRGVRFVVCCLLMCWFRCSCWAAVYYYCWSVWFVVVMRSCCSLFAVGCCLYFAD